MSCPTPTDRDADRAFARYCRSGDADALGEVFDRTAPRLALLAGHLVPGDAQAVEDLVQTTFVEAMQAAGRFEPGRPVMPWLVTILGRRAANLRRDASRRRGVPDELAELVGDTPEPGALAADRELADQVAAALERLGTPYREALTLRVVHGLSPAEIARALGRPLGTVHAQLHRGAARLRALLPAGVAGILAALLTTGDALAAVRGRLVDAARLAVGPATVAATAVGPTTLVTWWIMNKLTASVLLASLVCLALWALVPWGDDSTRTPLANAEQEGAAHRQAIPGATDDASRTPLGAERAAVVETPLPPPAAASEELVTFVGRVVLVESGSPLPGATVRARLYPRRFGQTVPELLAEPRVATTDAAGRYALTLPPNVDLGASLIVLAPGRATMVADWNRELRAGAVIDSGDVPMALGAELSLRVTDERDDPVVGFDVQLRGPTNGPRSTDGEFSPLGWGGTRTSDGRGIAGPRSVLAGTWSVDFAAGTGHEYRGPDAFAVLPGRTEQLVEIPLAAPPRGEWTVAGVVVDERGQPVVGVDVALQQPAGQRGLRAERTFGQGRFHVPGLPPERGPVTVKQIGAADEFEILSPREPVTTGIDDLRIVVRRTPRSALVVRIADGRDGNTATRVRQRLLRVRHSERGTRLGDFDGVDPESVAARSPADGAFRFEGLRARDHLLLIASDDRTLAPLTQVELRTDSPTTAPIEVRLQPAVTWRVQVRTPAGAPVADSTVELLRGIGRTRVGASTWTQPLERLLERGPNATFVAARTQLVRTDRGGEATLRSGSDLAGCALRIRGHAHTETFVALEGAAGAEATRTVTVTGAAILRGRLGPLELVQELGPSPAQRTAAGVFADPEEILGDRRIEIELAQTDGRHRELTTVDDEGHFAFDAIPPGAYAVTALLPDVRGDGRLAELSLAAGEVRDFEFDLAPLRPATVRGIARLDDRPPPPESELQLGSHRIGLDPNGRFEIRLLPGTRWVSLAIRKEVDSGTTWTFERAEPLDLIGGETRDVVFDFVRRGVDLHVTDARGAPIASKWIVLSTNATDTRTAGFVAVLILDADGRASHDGSWSEDLDAVLWLDPPPFGAGLAGSEPGRDAARREPLGRVGVPPGDRRAGFEFVVDQQRVGR